MSALKKGTFALLKGPDQVISLQSISQACCFVVLKKYGIILSYDVNTEILEQGGDIKENNVS